MDRFNRLTRNDEWVKGARYRVLKYPNRAPREWRAKPEEVTFLGWADGGRLVGIAELLLEDGKKMASHPLSWKGQYVRIDGPAEAGQSEVFAAAQPPLRFSAARWP